MQKKIGSRIYFSLKTLKKLNYGKKKAILLYNRSQNIQKRVFQRVRVFIDRGLYPNLYYPKVKISCKKLKYGMFSFTRKPFAIPEKKISKKR